MRYNDGFGRNSGENIDSGSYREFDANGVPIQAPPNQQASDIGGVLLEPQFYENSRQAYQEPGFALPQQGNYQQSQQTMVGGGHGPNEAYSYQPQYAGQQGPEQPLKSGQFGDYNGYQPNGRADELGPEYNNNMYYGNEDGDRGLTEIKQTITNVYTNDNGHGGRAYDKVRIGATAALVGVAAVRAKKFYDHRKEKQSMQREEYANEYSTNDQGYGQSYDQGYDQPPKFDQQPGDYNGYPQNEGHAQSAQGNGPRSSYDYKYDSGYGENGEERGGLSELKQKATHFYKDREDEYGNPEYNTGKILATGALAVAAVAGVAFGVNKLLDKERARDNEERDRQIGGNGNSAYEQYDEYPNDSGAYPSSH
ncbi:hypothetical protein GGI21_000025 [Coemansia aciculifera]|nr:hypothetical protein GGI21_000025 [Coemansia aciculifera]